MSAHSADKPEDRDPIAELLSILAENTPSEDALDDADDLADDALLSFETIAANLPVDAFDPLVLAAVDRVINDSESVGVPARQRLIAGAERGVRWHRRLAGPLPPLLQRERVDHQIAIATITDVSGLPESVVHEVERGDTSIDKLKPEQLADWIRAVRLATSPALAALRRSLRLHDGSVVFAASGNRSDAVQVAHQQFFDAVERALSEDGGSSGEQPVSR
jgi:hypothetical protein